MAGFGWHNGWPLQWGGGPSDTEAIYLALRNAVGEGGAGPEDGIEDCWRQARAIGLAAAEAGNLRASLQALPSRATDALPYYEELLALPPGPTDTDVDRRERATARWTSQLAGVMPDLLDELELIDASFGLLTVDSDRQTTTRHGLYYAPFDGSEPFNLGVFGNAIDSTAWPNYSDAFRLSCILPVADVTDHGPAVLNKLARASDLLGDALPAWCDFVTLTSAGFELDRSPLDLTSMNES